MTDQKYSSIYVKDNESTYCYKHREATVVYNSLLINAYLKQNNSYCGFIANSNQHCFNVLTQTQRQRRRIIWDTNIHQ